MDEICCCNGRINFEVLVGGDEGGGEGVVGCQVVEDQVEGVDFEVDFGGEGGVVGEVEEIEELGVYDVVVG